MTDKDLAIGEFSIMELEDRLEFAELCDDNCGCGTGSTGPVITVPVGGGGGGGGIEPDRLGEPLL
ncbi:MAG TPA: hypothetical protein VE913_03005 [Longimicrobium sp.]|nr:hypothetical protein [Longimicrobium sp.]